MNLFEELKAISEEVNKNRYFRLDHEEDSDELFERVVYECRKRSRQGYNYLSFNWDFRWTSERDIWDKRHNICLEVVERLKKEGLKARCLDEFRESIIDSTDRIFPPFGSHKIKISWEKE